MTAKFVSLDWRKGGGTELIDRKKGEKAPKRAIQIVYQDKLKTVYLVSKKTAYILTVREDDGTEYSEDIYGIIKYYKDIRITVTLRSKLENHMRNYDFKIEKGVIMNLYRCIENFFEVVY